MLLRRVNLQKKEDSNISVLMRIMTNYLQILAAALSYNLQFPNYVLNILSSARQAGESSGVFLSFDWLLMDTSATEVFDNIAYLKVMCIAVLPAAMVVVAIVAFRLIFLLNTVKFKRFSWVTTITILFLLHPSLTQYSLRIFKWVNVGESINKVEMDITTDCWSAGHIKWIFALCKLLTNNWVALPMIILYVIGCPALAFTILYKKKDELDNPEVLKYLLLLYQGLKHDKYYWELVNTFRKWLLLSFHAFIPDEFRIMKALFGVLTMGVISIVQARLSPFKIEAISKLGELACMTL